MPDEHAGVALRHAVEVRHESFMDDRWLELARGRGVATVFTDSAEHPSLTSSLSRSMAGCRMPEIAFDER